MEVQRSQSRMKGRGARLVSKGLRLPRGEVPDRGCLQDSDLAQDSDLQLGWAGGRIRDASALL